MDLQLQGKHAVVTGSTAGIGFAIARRLAAEGALVTINGRTQAAVDTALTKLRAGQPEADVRGVAADLGNAVGCAALAAALGARGADILVNNLGIFDPKPFEAIGDDDWQRFFDINVMSGVRLARALLPGMVERNWGRIVNFSGMNSIAGYADRPAVSVAKHGAWGLTKVLAKEFAPKGITANIISPGPIAPDEGSPPSMVAHIQAMASRVPAGRLGTPDEIAAMVGLLVSDDGAFINGQMLQVNGAAQT